MDPSPPLPAGLARTLPLAFVAGFVGVLIFHQGTYALLYGLGLIPRPPFSLEPTEPLGVPQVVSSAFWGGVWCLWLPALLARFPAPPARWIVPFLFGAFAPTLVAWFVVFPLKGIPVGGGWVPVNMLRSFLVNGFWALGSSFLLQAQLSWGRSRAAAVSRPLA